MKLRPFQRDAVEETLRHLHKKPILVSPTGSGKTVMAVEIARRCGSALWVAHRRELIDQAASHLNAIGIETGFILAGRKPNPKAPVQVASIQTLVNRKIPKSDVIFIDECHHAKARSYSVLFDEQQNAPIIGLSATPFRLDGKPLGGLFNHLVIAARASELTARGELHEPRVLVGKPLDMKGVRVTRGDFATSALEDRVATNSLVCDVVNEWKTHADNRRTVVFAVSIAHSKKLVDQFVSEGVRAEHLDFHTHHRERSDILNRLATGETTVLSQCQLLTEGWDLPALEVAVIARPTASLNLHLQMIGRIMRSAPGKTGALVLDHASNHLRHGPVTRNIEYSLDRKQESESAIVADYGKRCPQCYILCDRHAKTCQECNYVFQSSDAKVPLSKAGVMQQLRDEFAERVAEWKALEIRRINEGRHLDWAKIEFYTKFREWPTLVKNGRGYKLIDPTNASSADKEQYYRELYLTAIRKHYKIGWASHQYREIFGVWPNGFVTKVRKSTWIPIDKA